MGRGDKKTKKGKIFAGSFGNKRLRKKSQDTKKKRTEKTPSTVNKVGKSTSPTSKVAPKKKASAAKKSP